VQHRLRAERFRLRDGRGERLAMVVTVGDDADFQVTSFAPTLSAPRSVSYRGPDARIALGGRRILLVRDPDYDHVVACSASKFFLWRHSLFFAFASPHARKISRIRGGGRLMFTNNPFAELSASIPPAVMQAYVFIMIVLVAAGTLFDIVHKGSARYFFDNWRKSKSKAPQQVGGGELAALAVQTGLVDVLTSGEFCNARRRVAHLLTMYGFVIYLVTTAIMVFAYPTPATPTPALLPLLWWIGGLMVCLGGYWFWFFIRVDVAAEGGSPFRIMRADLFILSLLGSVTLGLIWAFLQTRASSGANVFFGLYIIATTVLFGSVPWSKFAHMFFKPAAAFEKRVSYANGTRSNLPGPADKPEQFGSAREQPRHY
jgi:hypothetical protein